jgi:hypothetical protein
MPGYQDVGARCVSGDVKGGVFAGLEYNPGHYDEARREEVGREARKNLAEA